VGAQGNTGKTAEIEDRAPMGRGDLRGGHFEGVQGILGCSAQRLARKITNHLSRTGSVVHSEEL
jgi:hypothetical protein